MRIDKFSNIDLNLFRNEKRHNRSELSRGDICVVNSIPLSNGASLGSQITVRQPVDKPKLC